MHREGLAALAAALLAGHRAVRLTARGASMAPFIRDGEAVLVEPLRAPPRRGEVVLRRAPGGALALHRVVRCTAGGLVTRGDATAVEDEPAAAGDALGRVVEVGGRRRLHLTPAGGCLVLRGLGLRHLGILPGRLGPLARGARALAARFP